MRCLTFCFCLLYLLTPSRRCIPFWEDDNWNGWCFNCIHKRLRNFISSVKLVINESLDILSTQSRIEMASKVVAGVLSSETNKHIILLVVSRRRSHNQQKQLNWLERDFDSDENNYWTKCAWLYRINRCHEPSFKFRDSFSISSHCPSTVHSTMID